MKRLRNEKGYSLLTVFLTMTIFTILFLSFMGLSFNSVKQNEVVEEHTQAVTLAEMGVSYFQSAIKAIYKDKQATVNAMILDEMVHANITQPPYTQEQINQYTDRAVELMALQFKIGIATEFEKGNYLDDPLLTKYVNSDSDLFYKIKILNINEDYANDEIKIKFESVGEDKDPSPPLTSEMKIKITKNEGNTGGIHIGLGLPNFNNIPKPEGCTEIICGDLLNLLDGVFNWLINNFNNVTNKTIYSSQGLTLDNKDNINSSENLKMHVVDDIIIQGNILNATDLLLETQRNAIFGSQLTTLGNSKLFVKNNLTTNGITNLQNNSLLYVGNELINNQHLSLYDNASVFVGGTAKVTDKLNITSSAKMCVRGNVEINDLSDINIDSDLGLIIKNKLFLNGTEYIGPIAGVSTGPQKYDEICEPVLPYTWSQQLIQVIDYDY